MVDGLIGDRKLSVRVHDDTKVSMPRNYFFAARISQGSSH